MKTWKSNNTHSKHFWVLQLNCLCVSFLDWYLYETNLWPEEVSGMSRQTSLKWLSDHKRSLACDFSLVWNFWLCSRQYFWLLSCSRFILQGIRGVFPHQFEKSEFLCFYSQSTIFMLLSIDFHQNKWKKHDFSLANSEK